MMAATAQATPPGQTGMSAPPAKLDARWMRWGLTASVLLSALSFLPVSAGTIYAPAALLAFPVLLCLYFTAILLRRLQCSLLELCVLIALLGNVCGILITTPGFVSSGTEAWAVVVIGAFLFFMRQADVLAPEPHEIRVELPDAFKQ